MEDKTPDANTSTQGNSALAKASVILSVLGFALPCLTFLILGFLLNDAVIDMVGLYGHALLNACIPMALWIVGPLAILVGIRSLPNRRLGDIREIENRNAKIGIVLGILTVPCVLFPLILFLLLANFCAQGC